MSVTVFGDAFVDVIVPASNICPGETYYRKSMLVCGGTANVALQIGKLGGKVNFIGKVGDDVFGRFFKNTLEKYNVFDLTCTDNAGPTGTCVSLCFDNNERTLIANRGVNDCFTLDDLHQHSATINESEVFYFSGYSLQSKTLKGDIIDFVSDLQRQCKVFLNPGAPNIIDKPFISLVTDRADCLILNYDEAKRLTFKDNLNSITKDLMDIVPLSVITLGSDGCIISSQDDGCTHAKTKKLIVPDTTGAGDSFSAGFIFGRICGMNNVEAAMFGNNVAYDFITWKGGLLL